MGVVFQRFGLLIFPALCHSNTWLCVFCSVHVANLLRCIQTAGVEGYIVESLPFPVMALDSLPLFKVRFRMQMIRKNWEVCSPVDDFLFLFVTVVHFGY